MTEMLMMRVMLTLARIEAVNQIIMIYHLELGLKNSCNFHLIPKITGIKAESAGNPESSNKDFWGKSIFATLFRRGHLLRGLQCNDKRERSTCRQCHRPDVRVTEGGVCDTLSDRKVDILGNES